MHKYFRKFYEKRNKVDNLTNKRKIFKKYLLFLLYEISVQNGTRSKTFRPIQTLFDTVLSIVISKKSSPSLII